MARLFNIFRSGATRGYQDGFDGLRHRAEWELRWFTSVLTWVPGTDIDSFVEGYRAGYTAGFSARHTLQRIRFDV